MFVCIWFTCSNNFPNWTYFLVCCFSFVKLVFLRCQVIFTCEFICPWRCELVCLVIYYEMAKIQAPVCVPPIKFKEIACVYLFPRDSVIKYHKLGGLKQWKFIFPWFQSLGVWNQGVCSSFHLNILVKNFPHFFLASGAC